VACATPLIATPRPTAAAGVRPSPQETPGVAPSVQGVKRPMSVQCDSPRAQKLHDWLLNLDDGAGAMLQYFDVLVAEFDSDITQIKAVKIGGDEANGILGVVDPSFWNVGRVAKLGHKMLFARGIQKL